MGRAALADKATDILERGAEGERLSADELLALYEVPQAALSAAADAARLRRADPEVATYTIGGNVDYTNICVVGCKFCAYYRSRRSPQAYALSVDEVAAQVDTLVELGALDVCIQGGVNPKIPFTWYLDVFRRLKRDHPQLHVDALSPEEVLGLERQTGRLVGDLLAEMAEAGMDGMPGASSEIFVDELRAKAAPARIRTSDWFRMVEAAQVAGLHIPWVGLVFGLGDERRQRVDHLLALRAMQDRFHELGLPGVASFKAWPMRTSGTKLASRIPPGDPAAVVDEYLREVAIARLALDNVVHHRAVWRTMGFSVAARALRGGADDLCGTGSINAVDAVLAAAGVQPIPPQEILSKVRGCISEAGYTPAFRGPHFEVVEAPRRREAQAWQQRA